ncbi:MAG: RCC1 domain-containing protein [Myxococcaceae bacterium]
MSSTFSRRAAWLLLGLSSACVTAPKGRDSGFWSDERERPLLSLGAELPAHLRLQSATGTLIGQLTERPTAEVPVAELARLGAGRLLVMTSERRVFSRHTLDGEWQESFTEPVKDWSPSLPHDAVLASGRLQRRNLNGALTTFGVAGEFDGVVHRCESMSCVDAGRALEAVCVRTSAAAPVTCYSEDQGERVPTLRVRGTFGPVTSVEFDALKSMPVELLAAWRAAGGATDDSVRQLRGRRTERAALICALDQRGDVTCLGTNAHGQRASAEFSDALKLSAVSAGLHGVALAAGADHACVLDAAGKAWCWGLAWRFPTEPLDATVKTKTRTCRIDEVRTEAWRVERQRRADAEAEACDHRCGRTDPVPVVPIYVEADGCTAEPGESVVTTPTVLRFAIPVRALEAGSRTCAVLENDARVCGQ